MKTLVTLLVIFVILLAVCYAGAVYARYQNCVDHCEQTSGCTYQPDGTHSAPDCGTQCLSMALMNP